METVSARNLDTDEARLLSVDGGVPLAAFVACGPPAHRVKLLAIVAAPDLEVATAHHAAVDTVRHEDGLYRVRCAEIDVDVRALLFVRVEEVVRNILERAHRMQHAVRG